MADTNGDDVLNEAQLAEGLRSLELQARTAAQLHAVARSYQQIKRAIDDLSRRKDELVAQITEHEATMARSKDLQFEAIRRFEKERMQKEAEEKAKFDATKKELYAEGDELARAIQDQKDRLAAAEKRAVEAEAAVQDKIDAIEQAFLARQQAIEQELALLEEPLLTKRKALDEINGQLNSIQQRVAEAAMGALKFTGNLPVAPEPESEAAPESEDDADGGE